MVTLTQQGIEAMRRGDKNTARQLLQQAIQLNPQDINAWLWLSGAVSTDQERLNCLQQVIKIDPENAVAAKGIAQLISRGAVTVEIIPVKNNAQHSEPVGTYQTNQPASPDVIQRRLEPMTEQPAVPQPIIRQQRPPSENVIFKVSPSPVPVLTRGGFLLIFLALFAMLLRRDPFILLVTVIPLAVFFIALLIVRLVQRSFAVYTLTSSQLIVQKGVLNKQKKNHPYPQDSRCFLSPVNPRSHFWTW